MRRLMVSLPRQTIFVAPGKGMGPVDCICFGAPYSQTIPSRRRVLCRLALNEICTWPAFDCADTSDVAWQPLHTTWTRPTVLSGFRFESPGEGKVGLLVERGGGVEGPRG